MDRQVGFRILSPPRMEPKTRELQKQLRLMLRTILIDACAGESITKDLIVLHKHFMPEEIRGAIEGYLGNDD